MSELIKLHSYSIDLDNNSLKNAKLNPLTTSERLALTLTSTDEGLISWDTVLNFLFIWDGSVWKKLIFFQEDFIFDQQVASATWTIFHNLNKYPRVIIIDTGNNEVEGDIFHETLNKTILSFSSPFSGKAILS